MPPNGSVWRTEALVGVNGKKLNYQVAGSWHQGDDYHDGDGNLVPASFGRANLAVHAAYRPDEKQEISFNVTRNFARNADYAALPMDLRSDDTWLLHTGHEIYLGTEGTLRLNTSAYASLVDHLMDNYNKVIEPRIVDAETAVQTMNLGGRAELFMRGEVYRFSAGAELNYENADGYRTREFLMGPNMGNILMDNVWQNSHILRTGIFEDYSRKIRELKYHLSARINLNTANAVDPDDSFLSLYDQISSVHVNPGITGGLEYRSSMTTSTGLPYLDLN